MRGKAAQMLPGRRRCEVEPNAPFTSAGQPTCSETCSPTQCGGDCYTQAYTCVPTACRTCAGSTCQSTCASTCVGGSCANYRFYGVNWWYCLHGYGRNWYADFGLPHGMFLNSCENALHWNDEGGERNFGPWNIGDGSYDETITRTVTSAGYTIRAGATVWYWNYYLGRLDWFWTYDKVSRSSTQSENRNDLWLPLIY